MLYFKIKLEILLIKFKRKKNLRKNLFGHFLIINLNNKKNKI